jgi:hypothetical protein
MKFTPLISQQFNGAIWRMEIDSISDTLFAEVRNNEEKQASFASIDLKTGKTWFKDFTTPERWLTGIEAAYDGVLLLHNYQSETGPAHKGLVAIDAQTAETLWSNYTHAFDHLTVNGPVVYDTRIHPRQLFLADIKTGAISRIYEPYVYKEFTNDIVTPSILPVELLPSEIKAMHPFGNSVHYLEYNNLIIVSLHALKAGQLNQLLYIFKVSADGYQDVYEDLLSVNIQKIQPEAFILHKNRLVYIKNKSELKVFHL